MKKWFKGFLSLVLILVMVLCLTPSTAFADEVSIVDAHSGGTYTGGTNSSSPTFEPFLEYYDAAGNPDPAQDPARAHYIVAGLIGHFPDGHDERFTGMPRYELGEGSIYTSNGNWRTQWHFPSTDEWVSMLNAIPGFTDTYGDGRNFFNDDGTLGRDLFDAAANEHPGMINLERIIGDDPGEPDGDPKDPTYERTETEKDPITREDYTYSADYDSTYETVDDGSVEGAPVDIPGSGSITYYSNNSLAVDPEQTVTQTFSSSDGPISIGVEGDFGAKGHHLYGWYTYRTEDCKDTEATDYYYDRRNEKNIGNSDKDLEFPADMYALTGEQKYLFTSNSSTVQDPDTQWLESWQTMWTEEWDTQETTTEWDPYYHHWEEWEVDPETGERTLVDSGYEGDWVEITTTVHHKKDHYINHYRLHVTHHWHIVTTHPYVGPSELYAHWFSYINYDSTTGLANLFNGQKDIAINLFKTDPFMVDDTEVEGTTKVTVDFCDYYIYPDGTVRVGDRGYAGDDDKNNIDILYANDKNGHLGIDRAVFTSSLNNEYKTVKTYETARIDPNYHAEADPDGIVARTNYPKYEKLLRKDQTGQVDRVDGEQTLTGESDGFKWGIGESAERSIDDINGQNKARAELAHAADNFEILDNPDYKPGYYIYNNVTGKYEINPDYAASTGSKFILSDPTPIGPIERKPFIRWNDTPVNGSIIFVGWNTKADGTGEWISEDDGQISYMGPDITLYAVYKLDFNLIYDRNDQHDEVAYTMAGENQTDRIADNMFTVNSTDVIKFRTNDDHKKNDELGADYTNFLMLGYNPNYWDDNLKEIKKKYRPYSHQGWSLDDKAYFQDNKVYHCMNPLRTNTNGIMQVNPAGKSDIDEANIRDWLAECFTWNPKNNIEIKPDATFSVRTYAVWDQYPDIWAYDVTYTKQLVDKYLDADNLEGFIELVFYDCLHDETDKEDDPRGYVDKVEISGVTESDLRIDDYGSTTAEVKVTDTAGNVTVYPIRIYIFSDQMGTSKENIDETPDIDDPTTPQVEHYYDDSRYQAKVFSRFIDELNYRKMSGDKPATEDGALMEYSKWYTNKERAEQIQRVFERMKSGTYTGFKSSYVYTISELQYIQDLVKKNGIGKTSRPDIWDETKKWLFSEERTAKEDIEPKNNNTIGFKLNKEQQLQKLQQNSVYELGE